MLTKFNQNERHSIDVRSRLNVLNVDNFNNLRRLHVERNNLIDEVRKMNGEIHQSANEYLSAFIYNIDDSYEALDAIVSPKDYEKLHFISHKFDKKLYKKPSDFVRYVVNSTAFKYLVDVCFSKRLVQYANEKYELSTVWMQDCQLFFDTKTFEIYVIDVEDSIFSGVNEEQNIIEWKFKPPKYMYWTNEWHDAHKLSILNRSGFTSSYLIDKIILDLSTLQITVQKRER